MIVVGFFPCYCQSLRCFRVLISSMPFQKFHLNYTSNKWIFVLVSVSHVVRIWFMPWSLFHRLFAMDLLLRLILSIVLFLVDYSMVEFHLVPWTRRPMNRGYMCMPTFRILSAIDHMMAVKIDLNRDFSWNFIKTQSKVLHLPIHLSENQQCKRIQNHRLRRMY